MSCEYGESARLLVQFELKIRVNQIEFREVPSASPCLKNLVAGRHRVFLHVKVRVDVYLEVSADAHCAVLLRDHDQLSCREFCTSPWLIIPSC